jgi:hypothetical protein
MSWGKEGTKEPVNSSSKKGCGNRTWNEADEMEDVEVAPRIEARNVRVLWSGVAECVDG